MVLAVAFISSLFSHTIAFVFGAIFSVVILGIAIILLLQSSDVGSSKRKRAKKRVKTVLHESQRLGNNGEYYTQFQNFGWMRISNVVLPIEQLFMDSSGKSTLYFLGGLGSDLAKSEQKLGHESFAPVEPIASTHHGYMISIKAMGSVAIFLVDAALQTSSYFVSRFLGERSAKLPHIAMELPPNTIIQRFEPPWTDAFVVLKNDRIFVYSSDETLRCLQVFHLQDFDVDFYPKLLPDHELFLRQNPLKLSPKKHGASEIKELYIYTLTGSEKEDWYILIRRATLSSNTKLEQDEFQTTTPTPSEIQETYLKAMKKLTNSIGSPESPKDPSTAWINALLGRIFVGFHANNPHIKNYLIQKLNSHRNTSANNSKASDKKPQVSIDRAESNRPVIATEASTKSFLGDIHVKDINIGDSLPVLTNARLVSFTPLGTLIADIDLKYTGGIRVEAATTATTRIPISTTATTTSTNPLAVSIKITRATATVRIMVKAFHETSRVWIGVHDGFDVGIQVEPVISERIVVQMRMVDLVVERRIKDALDEYFVLPNMDDFGFWPSGGYGGFFGNSSTGSGVDNVQNGGKNVVVKVASKDKNTNESIDYYGERISETVSENKDLDVNSTEEGIQYSYEKSISEEISENIIAGVPTSEFQLDKQNHDSDSQILVETFENETKTLKLHVIDHSTPVLPEIETLLNEKNENRNELNHAAYNKKTEKKPTGSFENISQIKNPRKSVFEFVGRWAEYMGTKAREYRAKEISRTLAKTALLTADIGLVYLGFKHRPGISSGRNYTQNGTNLRILQKRKLSIVNNCERDCEKLHIPHVSVRNSRGNSQIIIQTDSTDQKSTPDLYLLSSPVTEISNEELKELEKTEDGNEQLNQHKHPKQAHFYFADEESGYEARAVE
ncbi:hypothetical protein HK100_000769 [Physocladia obscura]|uniref:SMP-LTD domain-containing protein n=1 Tax=Physocladia obscura TaxID=109957 RepID=A0AAD5SYT8_9FUNG|nr:hypothetical protein HK100_000769 [Physocladia obscura]